MWYDHHLNFKRSRDFDQNLLWALREHSFPFFPGQAFYFETPIHAVVHALNCLHLSENKTYSTSILNAVHVMLA